MAIFDRDGLDELLHELGRRLAARHTAGRIYVVDGAAMALEWDARRSTHDVDALLRPRSTIKAVAAEIAHERSLPPDWLNDAVTPFVPPEAPGDGRVLARFGELDLVVAPPEHLLAMKMAAFRQSDMNDLRALVDVLGLTTPEEVADVCEGVYGPDGVVLPGRSDLLWQAGVILTRER